VNPVASSHFNFTTPEPTGVVVVLAPDSPPLLALVSLLAPVILTGNTAVVIASEKFPLPAATFAEILATSDLPGGVINLVTGRSSELLKVLAEHDDIDAVWCYGDESLCSAAKALSAGNLKQVWTNEGRKIDCRH